MAFLNETGVDQMFIEIGQRLKKKANSSDVTTELGKKADSATMTTELAKKVDKTTTVNGHALSTNITVTKGDVGLGSVVNTGDSATPTQNGTTKFTTGGAYTMKNDLTISLSSSAGTGSVLSVYTLKQGSKEIGKINIPKDLVVTSGSVVKGTFASDGSFTESTTGTATALKLIIANQATPVYINAADLVKDVVAGTGISVDNSAGTNKISVKYGKTSGTAYEGSAGAALETKVNSLNTDINNTTTRVANQELLETTWANLKSLRDNGKLVAGRQYRITDYNCTTIQKDTKSAGHQFDIIVTADSKNKLNEVARAIQHSGDTYFAKCQLQAWKLWYCLDNDTNRFGWADATSGKGVIYRMIDEFNNDVPYDFKNIQYLYEANTVVGGVTLKTNEYIYTFHAYSNDTAYGTINGDATVEFYSTAGQKYLEESCYSCLNNSMKPCLESSNKGLQRLNNNVFYCVNNNLYRKVNDSEIHCDNNSFGNDCYSNSFGNNCYYNSFGNNCDSNSFGNNCYSNSFGNNCDSNSFGNNCYSNSFGNSSDSNSFDNFCYSNSFGNFCYSNSFGNNCHSNSFGNNCHSNSFGNYCFSNSSGNSCYSNSFGDICNHNSFDNYCYSNSFGNNCDYNSFGNNCNYNKLGINSSNNKLDAYYTNNKFENGVQYVEFSGVGTNAARVQNYHIKQGMTFASNAKHTITAKTGLNYELTVAKQSNGTVVEYCEADLLKAIARTFVTDSSKTLD